MTSGISLYIFIFIAAVVALIVVKKVTSCLFKTAALLAIIAILAIIYFTYMHYHQLIIGNATIICDVSYY